MSAQVHIRNDATELRLLFEICRELEATGDLGKQMEATLRFMADHTAMLWGGIALAVRGDIAHPGASAAAPGKYGFWLSRLPAGFEGEHPVVFHREAVESMVLETGLPVAMQDEAANPTALHRGNLRSIYKEDVQIFAVPFMQGEKVLGALFADRLFADSVAAEEDVRLLQVIASIIAKALTVRFAFEANYNALLAENSRLKALADKQPGNQPESPGQPDAPLLSTPGQPETGQTSLDAVLDEVERRMITDVLAECRGNMAKAAAKLGITERIMGLRMRKYDLSFKDFRTKHRS